jgi:hypothetical protein
MISYKFRQNEDYERMIAYLGKECFINKCSTLFQPTYEKNNTAVIIDISPGIANFIGEEKNIESLIQGMKENKVRLEVMN